MRRIGLMGGSFNPIHNGHLNLARLALASGLVDGVTFLPTGNPPHKRAGLADKEARYEMVRLAIAGEENMSASREEIDREGVIYTVDTLAYLREKNPGEEYFYLIGADTLRALSTWRRPQDVIRLCAFLLMMRPGEAREETLRLKEEWEKRGARITVLEGEMMDISSSEVRRRCLAGESIEALVPAAVAGYIRKSQIYIAGDRP